MSWPQPPHRVSQLYTPGKKMSEGKGKKKGGQAWRRAKGNGKRKERMKNRERERKIGKGRKVTPVTLLPMV